MLFSIVGFLLFGTLYVLVLRRVFPPKSFVRGALLGGFLLIVLVWLVWLVLRLSGVTDIRALPFTNFLVGLSVFLFFYLVADLIASLFVKKQAELIRRYAFWLLIPITAVAAFLGHKNTVEPRVTRYEVHMPKVAGLDTLRVLLVSDIHIGDIIRAENVRRLDSLAKRETPDILLLGGDMIDRDPKYARDPEMMRLVRELTGRQDTYLVLGNHEYYSDLGEKIKWAGEMGTLLRDSVVEIYPGLYLIGRDSHTNDDRRPLNDLMSRVPTDAATILLQHEPLALDEIRASGIDLSLHGHTHNGQVFLFWPLVALAHERTYGKWSRGTTTHIVSSGFGVSTSTLRIGSHSEIVMLTLVFDK